MKTCLQCGLDKPVDSFWRDRTRKSGRRETCDSCCKAYQRAYHLANREKRLAKSRAYYQENRQKAAAGQRAYREANKEMIAEKQRAWWAANSEAERSKRLLRSYGLIAAEHDAMLEAQGGGCAICGGLSSDGRRLAVDHDHATGRVRGLLCAHCNRAIGIFKDEPMLLRAAADYLETANERVMALTLAAAT